MTTFSKKNWHQLFSLSLEFHVERCNSSYAWVLRKRTSNLAPRTYVPCLELTILDHSFNSSISTKWMPCRSKKRNYCPVRYLTLESRLHIFSSGKKSGTQECGIAFNIYKDFASNITDFRPLNKKLIYFGWLVSGERMCRMFAIRKHLSANNLKWLLRQCRNNCPKSMLPKGSLVCDL